MVDYADDSVVKSEIFIDYYNTYVCFQGLYTSVVSGGFMTLVEVFLKPKIVSRDGPSDGHYRLVSF